MLQANTNTHPQRTLVCHLGLTRMLVICSSSNSLTSTMFILSTGGVRDAR